MRISILANFGMGLYKFRKELISKLLSKDMEVLVSFPQDEYTQKIEELGCSFIDTPLDRRGMNPIKDIRLLRHYRSIIKENKPNVVLTYTLNPMSMVVWLVNLKIPLYYEHYGIRNFIRVERFIKQFSFENI